MTPEEKLDEIHDAVIAIKLQLAAKDTLCAATHKTVDSRLDGLHKKIVGNGQPGLEQNLQTLTSRFDKLETRIIGWASAAVFLGQIIGPKILSLFGGAK